SRRASLWHARRYAGRVSSRTETEAILASGALSCRADRRLAQTDQIRQHLVGSVGSRRKLTPQAKADVHPLSLPVGRLDEGSTLFAFIERKRVFEGHDVPITRVTISEEVESPLLNPALPRSTGQLVRKRHQRIAGGNDVDGGSLIRHAVIAD